MKSSDNLLVSIIVPVYKVEQYIERCIDSILKQTYSNLEIILVDDGSPDSSGEICDNYALLDSRIHVIHKTNGGLSDARNHGIDYATGDYMLFVDSDDFIELNAVEKLLDFAIDKDLDIGCADAYRVTQIGDNIEQSILISGNNPNQVLSGEEYLVNAIDNKKYSVAVWTKIYRSRLIKENHVYFKKGLYHEDEKWTPEVMLKANRVAYMNYPFYYYMIRKNSITQTGDRKKHIKDVIETCEKLSKEFNTIIKDEKNKKILIDYLVKLYINTSLFGNYNKQFYSSIISKKFALNNSYKFLTKVEATIFYINPKMYRILKQLYVKKYIEKS